MPGNDPEASVQNVGSTVFVLLWWENGSASPVDHSQTAKLKEATKRSRHATWELEMKQINGFCFLKLEVLGYVACHIVTSNQYCQNHPGSTQCASLLNDEKSDIRTWWLTDCKCILMCPPNHRDHTAFQNVVTLTKVKDGIG